MSTLNRREILQRGSIGGLGAVVGAKPFFEPAAAADMLISPATTTKPVVSNVSQATLPFGSVSKILSRIASLIWSAILSG